MSEEAATEMLGYAGYRVVNLKPAALFPDLDKLLSRLFRVKPVEMILFYRQLALLLESGINITKALELLQGKVANRTLKRVLDEVIADLRGGNQLSMALGRHPEVFYAISCRLLSIGEQAGNLETILRQIAEYMEREAVAGKSIKNALVYPVITAVVTIVVIAVLVTFVLPAFSGLYDSLGADLPLLTRLVIDATDQLRSYGVYLLLAIAAAGGLAFAHTRTAEGRYRLDRLVLSLPLVGRVNHLKELARCCRNIFLLFHAGLPLTEIMSLVIQGSSNRAMARVLTDVQQDMLKGEGLSRPMAKHPLFLPMMVQMVQVGEETGNLDTALLAVAQSYETEAEDITRSLIGLIQPAMMLIIAMIVGGIALSLVSAMYSIYGQVL
ncbi:type II secretion system F family protein [Chloroflexota bacterium]